MKTYLIWGRLDGGLFVEGSIINGKITVLPTDLRTFEVTEYCTIKQHKNYLDPSEIVREMEIYVAFDDDHDPVRSAIKFCEDFFTTLAIIYSQVVSFHFVNMKEVHNVSINPPIYRAQNELQGWQPYMHTVLSSSLVNFGVYAGRGYDTFRNNERNDIQKWLNAMAQLDDRAKKALSYYKRGLKLRDIWQDWSFLSFYLCVQVLGGIQDQQLKESARVARNRIAHPEVEVPMDINLLSNLQKIAKDRLEKYIIGRIRST